MNGLYWYGGTWSTTQPKIAGPMDLGFWSASSVFDGARAIKGCLPDIEAHCQRVVRSATSMLLEPTLSAGQIEDFTHGAGKVVGLPYQKTAGVLG